MSEARVFADNFHRTFAQEGELMRFLENRTKNASWIRKPTKELRLIPVDNAKVQNVMEEDLLEDTKQHTQLVMRMRDEYYPVRSCAIQTILKRAGISGSGLNRLEIANYARVINMCLQKAKGESLIRIADGKVSATHGGDYCDYKILDTEAVFQETINYLNKMFPGYAYYPGSGSFDHSLVTAMWELNGQPELLTSYQQALDEHGIQIQVYAPALRLITSDVAAKSVTLYPMLICDSHNQTLNLGKPIRLEHSGTADIMKFKEMLKLIYSRYQDAIADVEKLLDIPIRYPKNCLTGVLKKLAIGKKLGSKVAESFVARFGEGPTSAHELYYALSEASFIAACEGLSSTRILQIEEEITKALHYDWSEFDLYGTVSW